MHTPMSFVCQAVITDIMPTGTTKNDKTANPSAILPKIDITKFITSRLATFCTEPSIIGMKLPAPRDELYGCIWLPRIRTKAQLHVAGELPEAYQRPFCHAEGVDGHFLAHFNTDQAALLVASVLPDVEFEEWFRGLRDNCDDHIAAWNEIAVNLGKPGTLMADRFAWARKKYYQHLNPQPETVFEALEADEGITRA